jgi:hypothetical protein
MPHYSLTPAPKFRVPNLAGAGLVGGKLNTYIAGTTTRKVTYSDVAGTPNTNPVILDLRGEADVWLEDGVAYKFVVTDSADAVIWTADNILTLGETDAPANGYLTKVSADDTTGGYLSGKIVAGAYATVTVNNPGASETLSIGFVPDWRVNVSDIDSPDYLEQKVRAGANVTVTKMTGMGGEYLEISASGTAQWETVTLGGTDYLTPVAGLPQFITTDIQHATTQVVVGSAPAVSGNFSGLSPDQLNLFNQASFGTVGLALADDGNALLSTSVGALLMEAPTGQYIKADVGAQVSDTQGRIVNSGTEIVLTVTDYDGGGLPTVVGHIAIGALGTTLGNAGKLVLIDAEGVKPSTNSGVDYTSVLSIDANGAVQKGAITASGIGATPACVTQTAVTNYTFTGAEASGQGWASDATGGNRTINIDADLFSTGFEANICKWDSSTNTVTIDAGSGNTVDGAQTYVLTRQWETVTLLKDGANTWKIKSNYIDPDWFLPITGGTLIGPLQITPSAPSNTPGGSENTGTGFWTHLKKANTTGYDGVGDIGRFLYNAYDSANATKAYARTKAAIITNTAGSEDGAWGIELMVGGTANTNVFRMESLAGVVTAHFASKMEVSDLAGSGTRMATVSSTGQFGSAAIPTALVPWLVKTANYTAVNYDRILCNTSGGAFAITLPATPSAGDSVQIGNGGGWGTYTLTIARNSSTIMGSAADLTVSVDGPGFTLVYSGTTWRIA